MSKIINKLLSNQGDNYIFPFFWLHGEKEEVLREYMKVINEDNIGAVCIESRPHPDFCGPQWWHDMDIILDEARKRHMKVWILDDSHFPTGFANGALDSKPKELHRQSICCRIYDVSGKTHLHIDSNELLHPEPFVKTMIENYVLREPLDNFDDDRLLSLTAIQYDKSQNPTQIIDLLPLIKDDALDWDITDSNTGKWKVYVLQLSRNKGYHRRYINMLNRSSCKVLLDSVYEPHYEHYKSDFGKTIAGFFSDEPELGNGHIYDFEDAFGKEGLDYPWSDEVEEEIKTRFNSNFYLLSLLWENDADPFLTAKVRYHYMDVITKTLKEDFSKQIGEWCRYRHVEYIGHLIEDNNHHSKTGCSLGHFFRGLSGQNMSGIDDIGGQVLPQGDHNSYNDGFFQRRDAEFYHFLLGKLASSSASIEPLKKGNSMCEIFGNYGWSEGLRLEKYLADHFLVRGVNHFVPHAFSAKEFPDTDCPPHFYAHGNNPEYRHFGFLMRYMNNVSEIISNGRHVAPVAVLYNAESDWTCDVKNKCMTDDVVGCILCENQVDYDIVPQDVFESPSEFCMSIEKGFLKVNTQMYRMLIVPFTNFITKEFAEAIKCLSNSGVSVIFVDEFPKGICNTKIDLSDGGCNSDDESTICVLKKFASAVKKSELIECVKAVSDTVDVEFKPSNSYLRFIHYVHDEEKTSVYMLVNEGSEVYRGSVTFSFLQDTKKFQFHYIYDAWNNKILDFDMKDTTMNVVIEPLKSLIVVFDNNRQNSEAFPTFSEPYFSIDEINKSDENIALDKQWKRSICRSIEYPHFANEKLVSFPDSLEKEMPSFSGFIRYENAFAVKNSKDDKKLMLVITDAFEGVEVFINEKTVGIQVAPPFVFDISKFVVEGENRIRIEVATTLERELFDKLPQRPGRPKIEPKDPSGINGEVKIVRF